jgi:hypothetical protein
MDLYLHIDGSHRTATYGQPPSFRWGSSSQTKDWNAQGILTHELGHWIRLVDLGNSQDCEQYPQDCPPDNPCVAGEANLRTMCQPINYTESLYIRTLHHYDKRDADVVY